MTRKVKPLIFLEQLEQRILLSADGLLNVILPDQDQDMSLDGMQQVVQYTELLETQEQVEEQISLELTQPDTTNTDVCKPIITLLVDDENINDEAVDTDLSVDNIGPAQTGEIALLSNDFDDDIESKVGTSEDSNVPTCINDVDLSTEYATSIEIRGPPEVEIEEFCEKGTADQALELFSTSQALFVENLGQWSDQSVRYVHGGSFANVAITDSGVLFQITRSAPSQAEDQSGLATELYQNLPLEHADIRSLQFSASFVGANAVQPMGLERSESAFNYLLGDQANWRENVPSYQFVVYQDLYEEIDLHLWGLRSHLKYEFHVAPGADYQQITIHYQGIESLSLNEDGSLLVSLGGEWGELIDDAPHIYQEIEGQEVAVAGEFELLDANTYAFNITGAYDSTEELIIDPDLAWATYLGGGDIGGDRAHSIAVDSSGSVYVTGNTYSSGWATSGAYDESFNGWNDAFVAKLSPTGSDLMYMTYLGGSYYEWSWGIAVDSAGSAYVSGSTGSSGWATPGAYDEILDGGDAFVAKLSPTGSELLYATYLGGSSSDSGYRIAVDSTGSVYVSGTTSSPGWATSGAYDESYNGGNSDVFLAKLNPTGSDLLYATYLGGGGDDNGFGIALDSAGSVYVTGETNSSGWATSGAYDESYNGGDYDAFLAKLNPTGSDLLYATYLGGGGWDSGWDIALDSAGSAYLTGYTESSGWATSGAYDESYNGNYDAFLAKLSPTGSDLLYATYLGGASGWDNCNGIALDSAGCVYVAGETSSPGWATPGAYDEILDGSDAFVAKLSPSGSDLMYMTYLGGSSKDMGWDIALDSAGSAYLTGWTFSPGWATSGAYDESHNGHLDAFVAKISIGPAPIDPIGVDNVDVPFEQHRYAQGDGEYQLEFTEAQELIATIRVDLTGDNPVGPNGEDLRAIWENGIESAWSGQYEVVDGIYRYPIIVDVEWVEWWQFADVNVEVVAGDSDANGDGIITDDEPYVHSLRFVTGEPSGYDFALQGIVAAHEAGHWMGLFDEYSPQNSGDPPSWPLYFPLNADGTDGAMRTDVWDLYDEPNGNPLNVGDADNNGVTDWIDGLGGRNWVDGRWVWPGLDTEGLMGSNGSMRVRYYENLLNWLRDESGRGNLVLAQAPTFDDRGPLPGVPDGSPLPALIAEAGGPYVGDEGGAITLDASGSTGDGASLQYRWDFDSDGTWDMDWSADSTASHTWDDDWTGTATVEVSDGFTTSTDTASVTVNNVAPVVTIETLPQTLYKHEEMILLASFTDPGTADSWTASIDWGDGNITKIDPLTGSVTGSHAYTVSGTFTIIVSVTDDDGGIGTATMQITVLDTLSAFEDLLSKVANLDLSNGVEASLTAKLEAGIHLFGGDLGSDRSLTALLDAFIRGVNHWYEKDKLIGEAYNELLTYAELIRLDILSDI